MTPETYQQTVDLIVTQVLAGYPVEDILTDPRGPASEVIGECDLDVLADAVHFAVSARQCNVYSAAYRLPD